MGGAQSEGERKRGAGEQWVLGPCSPTVHHNGRLRKPRGSRSIDIKQSLCRRSRCWSVVSGGQRDRWQAPPLTIHSLAGGLCQGCGARLCDHGVQELRVGQEALGLQVSGAKFEEALPQLLAHLRHRCGNTGSGSQLRSNSWPVSP